MRVLIILGLLFATSLAQTDAAYRFYRVVVTRNNKDGAFWCTQELSFYDTNMNRIMVDPSMGSAETEYGSSQTVDKAFDEYTDGDGQYYCSLTGHPTGWLQYEFSSPVTLSRYGLEEGFWLTPRDWTFEGSNDGTSWEVLDEQSGHDTWYTGEIKEFELGATSKTNAHVDYCVECTCSGYDSKRSKYYGCRRQNRYDCNKGFCVRCQHDGVTP
eukprot:UN25260